MSSPGTIETEAACLDCGYQLRGLPSPICPECGRQFDPNNPDTFKDLHKPKWWQSVASPPSLWEIAIAAVFTLSYLNVCSVAGGPLGVFAASDIGMLLGFALAPGLLTTVTLLLAFRCAAVNKAKASRIAPTLPATARRRWRWIVLPICLLIIGSTFLDHWPLRLRFAVSRSAFEEAADATVSHQPGPPMPQWVGLYRVHVVIQSKGTVGFITGMSLADPTGFIYDPTIPPEASHPYWLKVAPNWYIEEW